MPRQPPHTNISILNLILYSDTDPVYVAMRDTQRSYLRTVSNFTYFFYCYREEQTEEVVLEEGDTLVFRGRETYVPGILEKTLAAMTYLRDRPFQYFLRTNVSTAVDIVGLRKRLQHIQIRPDSPSQLYAGPITTLHRVDTQCGITEAVLASSRGVRYARGIAILLSRGMFDLLLDNADAIPRHVVDDVAIGLFFGSQNIPCLDLRNGLIENPPTTLSGGTRFIYRHKTEQTDRQGDLLALRRTLGHLQRVQQLANAHCT